METKIERQEFDELVETARAVLSGDLVHCRNCGKSFKPYKVETFGQECNSTICRECRKKYS